MKKRHIHLSGAEHGTLKSYLAGFILSVILTVIPFALVMMKNYGHTFILYTVVGMAVVQILVHLIYFLHMNRHSEDGWNYFAFVFTMIILSIIVIGSLWIMHHLDHNMMGN